MTALVTRWNKDHQLKEKLCPHCKEWLPATEEFFYRRSFRSPTLHSWCKACVAEERVEANARKRKAKA